MPNDANRRICVGFVKRNEKKLKKWLPHVSSAQLKAAILYYQRFPQESAAAPNLRQPPEL